MLTVNDFLAQYKNYSDEQLLEIYRHLNDYSAEAQEALTLAMEGKGGLQKLEESLQQKKLKEVEHQRLQREIDNHYRNNRNVDSLKSTIVSEVFTAPETRQIIEKRFKELETQSKDENVTPKTVSGSIIGGLLGSVIGGGLLGYFLIETHRLFLFFILGLAIINYGFIRFFTKQSKANTVVMIAVVLSTICAVLIAQLLLNTFGQAQ